jgi:hypothetical protein
MRQYYVMDTFTVTYNGEILRMAGAPNRSIAQNRGGRVLGLKLGRDGELIPWTKLRRELDSKQIVRGYVVTYENKTKTQWRMKKVIWHVEFPIAGVTWAKRRWVLNQKRIPASLINKILNIAEQREAFLHWIINFNWVDASFAEIKFARKNVALVFFPTRARLCLVSRENRVWRTKQIGKIVKQVCSTTTDKKALYLITKELCKNSLDIKIKGYHVGLEPEKIVTLPKKIVQLLVDKATISPTKN